MTKELETAENEGMPVEVPIGADTEPTTEPEQEAANDSNMAAQEFSQKVYDIVQEYQAKIPLNYMMKILTAVLVDLQAALIGTNMTYVVDTLRKEFEERLQAKPDELIIA